MKKAMKKMIMAGALCIAGAALIAGCGDSGSSAGGGKQFLNIATGGTAGTYYPLGGALADRHHGALGRYPGDPRRDGD